MKNIVLFGPPGAGKGTQAQKLALEYQIPHIATGDILRAAVAVETELGKEAKSYMDRGELVPDDLVIAMVIERLEQPDAITGFLLDGFPRTVHQAESLDKKLSAAGKAITGVISLEVTDGELIKRLTGRRICRTCSTTFHDQFNPPARAGMCDRCGGELYQREDDSESVAHRRLEVYDQQTAPVLEFYGRKAVLRPVDGEQDIDKVAADLMDLLKV